jgi:hypothetical protein
VTEEDANKINGLCDYVPSEIPASYCWGTAGFYETTMNDGTIYRMLKITYRSDNDTVTIDKENGSASFDPSVDTHEFCISVCDFNPDITDIIKSESIAEEQISEKIKNGIFCVEYDGYYLTVEPLSLTTDEVLEMIKSVK